VLERFTLQTEAGAGDPIKQVSSVIEYGQVTMGDRHYLCPIRSLAFSVQEADSCRDSHHHALPRPVAMLNRIVFSDYHRLGSEMTIVPGAPQPGNADPHPGPEKPAPAQEPAAHPPAPASPAAAKIPKK
jgi:hypothetical protein